MKKFGLLILSFVVILGISISFADVIPDNEHRVNRCSNIKNVEIDKYKRI